MGQITIQCHAVIISALVALTAQFLGTNNVVGPIGRQEVHWLLDEVGHKRMIGVITRGSTKFACKKRRAQTRGIAIGQHPFQSPFGVNLLVIVQIEIEHLTIGQCKIVKGIKTPIAKETNGFVLQINQIYNKS